MINGKELLSVLIFLLKMPLFEQSSFINPIHFENGIKIRSTGFSVGQFTLTFLVAFLYS